MVIVFHKLCNFSIHVLLPKFASSTILCLVLQALSQIITLCIYPNENVLYLGSANFSLISAKSSPTRCPSLISLSKWDITWSIAKELC